MSSTLVVFLMTLTAVMTLPVFDPATPKVSILSIGMRTIESAIELVTEAAKQTAEFQPAANLKAGLMLTNHEAAFGRNTATKCTLANGAGVRLEFIEIGSKGLLPSYKPPQFLEPGEVASFLVEKNIPFKLKYNIQTFQGPGGWMGGDDTTAVTLSSTTVPAQINTDVQVGRGTTKYHTQISFDLSRDGDFYHFVATQSIGPDVPLPLVYPEGLNAWYCPGAFDIASGTWEDCSGNGNTAALSGSGLSESRRAGHGATSDVLALSGTTSSVIAFGAVIKSEFTVCSVTRYTGGAKQRILQGSTNWLHGHHYSKAGVAYYKRWKTAYQNKVSPNTDWVVMCGSNDAGSQLTLVNGVDVGTATGGTGDLSLFINAGYASNEKSDFAIAELVVWPHRLKDEEMRRASDHLMNRMG